MPSGNWFDTLINIGKFIITVYDWTHNRTTGSDLIENTCALLLGTNGEGSSPTMRIDQPRSSNAYLSPRSSIGPIGAIGPPGLPSGLPSGLQARVPLPERHLPAPIANLDPKNDEIAPDDADDRVMCCVCQSNYRKVILMPCKHTSTCIGCTKTLLNTTKLCPICRGIIGDAIPYHQS